MQAKRFGVEILSAEAMRFARRGSNTAFLRLADSSELVVTPLMIATACSAQMNGAGTGAIDWLGVYYGAA